MHWVYLIIAILGEVVATSALKAAEGFTRLVPSIIVVVGYGLTFFFLSLALKSISIGIAYAIWCGVGIILVSLIGFFYYKQSLDAPSIFGMTLIIVGVMVINLFSKSVVH